MMDPTPLPCNLQGNRYCINLVSVAALPPA